MELKELNELSDLSLYNLKNQIEKLWKKRADEMKKTKKAGAGFKFSILKTPVWNENVDENYLALKGLLEDEFIKKTILSPKDCIKKLGVSRAKILDGCFDYKESLKVIVEKA